MTLRLRSALSSRLPMADLILPLKGEYFDAILDGSKEEEFRVRNAYWEKRLRNRDYDRLIFTRGYPKGGGVEGETRITRKYSGFREITLMHPFFGDDPVEVFAIAAQIKY